MSYQYNNTLLKNAKSLPLICIPNRLLYDSSLPISEVNDEVRNVMLNMLYTMYLNSGIGLTAVQVGIMKKIIVIDIDRKNVPSEILNTSDEKEGRPIVHGGHPIFMANAEILETNNENQVFYEGCLSIPEVGAHIERPSCVKVKYLDYSNNWRDEWFGPGLISSCIQHEIDHSNGILFWDHLSIIKREQLENKSIRSIKLKNKKI
ncbi:peptide deformylase [Lyticum sinuosum]|uniref:Peptide deformylase n=1 Tax=Lyticum sinuosum TaxID=1332059 RepID=A0AAE5AHN4_9RICK|nr:peptide deformylase [Lyticum sinuosum]MDZ5760909.1 Peptide deformylase [Lyticum sinuosum]